MWGFRFLEIYIKNFGKNAAFCVVLFSSYPLMKLSPGVWFLLPDPTSRLLFPPESDLFLEDRRRVWERGDGPPDASLLIIQLLHAAARMRGGSQLCPSQLHPPHVAAAAANIYLFLIKSLAITKVLFHASSPMCPPSSAWGPTRVYRAVLFV